MKDVIRLSSGTERWLRNLLVVIPAFIAAPVFADDAAVGRDIYQERCESCHGRNMVSAGGLDFDLRKFPRDARDRFRQSVLKGTAKGMPAWESQLNGDDVNALWDYVKSGSE